MKTVLFIAGIDTDVGKTVATGLYARELAEAGCNVITQKLVQTGCSGLADDILSHRRLQGIEPTAFDADGTTAPYVFPYPCSPHMAAAQQGVSDEDVVARALAYANQVLNVEEEDLGGTIAAAQLAHIARHKAFLRKQFRQG